MIRVRFLALAVIAVAASACSSNSSGGLFDTTTTTTTVAATPTPKGELVLDQEAVQEGVTKILKERYNEDASDVRCPANQPVKKGYKFTCTVKVGGDNRTVTITVKSDDRAEYEVSQSD